MRSIILLTLTTAALLFSPTAFSQDREPEKANAEMQEITLDDVLGNYYNAIGGLENWSKVQTMTIEGVIITPQNQFPTTAINMRPDKCRVEHTINGQRIIQAYNGETAWQINPLRGDGTPSEITGDGAVYMREKCEIEGPLIGYRNKNREVTLEGKEKIDGGEAYKIKIAYNTGNLQTYFIDSSTFLPVKTVSEFKVAGQQASVTTFFEDYREQGNIVVPYLLKFDENGKGPDKALKVESVSINTGADSGIFSMP